MRGMRGSRAGHALALLLAIPIATAGCTTLSVEQEKKLGSQAQREVRKQYTLMRDRVTVHYVRDLGNDLVRAARPSPFEFRFYVVESEDLNAFAIPGGAIYVNTGLIQAVDNTGELAGVLAHEIGHVTARHVAQIANRSRNTGFVAQVFTIAVAILTGSSIFANVGQVAAAVAAQAYTSQYGREYEREADTLAIETLVRAGWDPAAMVTMFETLQKESGSSGMPQFLSSHPATSERIERVQAEIAQVAGAGELRIHDGGKLEIIQRRLELIIGTDSGSDLGEDEDDSGVLEEDDH